ncbi:hypothetical protein GCM10023085_56590 [Actinomadura viridis]|uniref:Tetrahydromethanopterin S-methyltransferase subunit A n=1 Tax=Actinomadura viridis TaxID=58110 RepID=A0A931DFQ3_9ACTN|nr:hypothetical protein [Actinomadura viridis]MBG6085928.1 tetrahydromethanopterin S-methyltransferase subunit A [Actinomadura viridis]
MVTGRGDAAVCTLTDRRLARALGGHPRVAVAGPLVTANLGLQNVVADLLRRSAVRHLVVCGRDSRLFRPGQTLLALAENGCGDDGTVIGAQGYRPVLAGLAPGDVEEFRRRVRVHDHIGVADPRRLAAVLSGLDALPPVVPRARPAAPPLERLPAGGPRRPIPRTAEGFLVVGVDRDHGVLVVRHYDHDLRAGRELRSHCPEALLAGVLRHGLIRDPSHAGYLGAELAKADTALRLDLDYVQDRPLARDRAVTPPAGRLVPEESGTAS